MKIFLATLNRCALLGLIALLLPASAPAQPKPAFTDLATHVTEQPAINSVVAQGIMKGVTGTQFNPDAANTRGDFVVSMQKMFNLTKPAQTVSFPDVPASSPIYAAVEAVAPYLRRQILCPGCALVENFLPNVPVSRVETAVIMTGILVAQNKVTLLTPAAAETALAPVTDVNTLHGPLRVYVATALQSGVITLPAPNQLQPAAQPTRADTATLLDTVQKKFSLPQVQP